MSVEEDLDTAPPGRLPGWLLPAGGLTVVAVLVAIALVVGIDDPTPRPTPTSTSPSLHADDVSVAALAASADDGLFFQVRGGRLEVRSTRGVVTHTSEPLNVTTNASDDIGLAVDDTARVVWAYAAGDNSPGHAAAYSFDDLRSVERISVPPLVGYAAAMDGDLYVSSSHGVLRHGDRGTGFATIGNDTIVALTADPVRQRVLYVAVGKAGFTLGSVTGATMTTGGTLAAGFAPSLAVVDGDVWVAGDLNGRSLLAPLDPQTLTPGRNLADPRDTAGVVIAGTGDASLLLRNRDAGPTLTCFGTHSGAVVTMWRDAAGAVAATRGRIVVAPIIGPARQLASDGCPG